MVERPQYLIRLKEVTQVVLQDNALCSQVIYIVRHRLGYYKVVELIAFAEVELDQPRCEHHSL